MNSTTEPLITFTVGRYNSEQTVWEAATNAPNATITLALFRAIFDAVGEGTIDTTGDIAPGVLLGLVGLGPHGAEEATAWLRLVCRWARRRRQRVGFTYEEPAGDAAISREGMIL